MKNAITLGDIGRTVLHALYYAAVWCAILWVTRQEISIDTVAMFFLFSACWMTCVNHTRMNRVFKAMEQKESGNG